MNQRNANGGVPTWLKVLLGVAAVGIVAIIIFVSVAMSWFENMKQETKDPDHAKKVAAGIVEIADPLPDGWKYAMGQELAGYKTAAISNRSGTSVLFLARCPKAMSKAFFEGQKKGAGLVVETEGEGTVGGTKFAFLRGRLKKDGRDLAAEMAQIPAQNGDVITIQAMQRTSEPYDPNAMQPIYDSIKQFR